MNRRNFVRGHAVALLGLSKPAAWWTNRAVRPSQAPVPVPLPPGAIPFHDPESTTLRDPRMAQLALRALDAAREAGAQYADVRMTNTLKGAVDSSLHPPDSKSATLGLSVRALVHGYWGWAATPTLSIDESVRVARLATALANTSAAHGPPRTVDLEKIPVVSHGDWSTPIKIDPFALELRDLYDWCVGMGAQLGNLIQSRGAAKSTAWEVPKDASTGVRVAIGYEKQERLFASTDGSLLTQTICVLRPTIDDWGGLIVPRLNTPVQAGWEWVADAPLVALFEAEMDRAAALPKLPQKTAEVGRYDIVFSAKAMAQILCGTFGGATEVDRALGYEANAGGTSYLGPDPLTRLGTAVAAPLIRVTGERSMPLGLATVKWDDEGMVSEPFSIIKDGVLADYQTTREQAAWLAPWYAKHGKPVQSHGCAAAPDALSVSMQHTPNLVLQPGPKDVTQDTLIGELEHGVFIEKLDQLSMDWQCLDGYCTALGGLTEIRHGKPVARLSGSVALTFRSDQLWKDVQAIGGAASAMIIAGETENRIVSIKGNPMQSTEYSISAVPARVKQLALIDPRRKAS